ncbi:Asp23/Gls24 family envelope stress response protein [Paenibacillus cellulositrophicus]|uniref:Asp23/Gls24 family envelope stress response protein n=1 Tax=Paenibacillus cellulositrophicus TaxID=562959 RepID=UPI00203CAC78|nr:Asp23/Gls24 family envelope stress response protein [Paenibacillus cellulositrophicus]MCM2996968.1 Asp23/Gls24 family envelope stress response protein [Paenibacillus cellulositrophicus]
MSLQTSFGQVLISDQVISKLPGDADLSIEVKVSVRYGIKIRNLCRELQLNIRESIKHYTGLPIDQVHIHLEGIVLEKL